MSPPVFLGTYFSRKHGRQNFSEAWAPPSGGPFGLEPLDSPMSSEPAKSEKNLDFLCFFECFPKQRLSLYPV